MQNSDGFCFCKPGSPATCQEPRDFAVTGLHYVECYNKTNFFTITDWKKDESEWEALNKHALVAFWGYGQEKGEKMATAHLQGWIQTTRELCKFCVQREIKYFSSSQDIHIEGLMVKSTPEKAKAYCAKDGKYCESKGAIGLPPSALSGVPSMLPGAGTGVDMGRLSRFTAKRDALLCSPAPRRKRPYTSKQTRLSHFVPVPPDKQRRVKYPTKDDPEFQAWLAGIREKNVGIPDPTPKQGTP